jgi:hypothetical protein
LQAWLVPVIAVQDLQWARRVVDHCMASLLDEASRHVADNETEGQHKKVLEVIRKAGRKGISKSQLCRKTWFVNRRQREEIMKSLNESGSVLTTHEKSQGTKPIERYYFNANAVGGEDEAEGKS